MSKSGALYFIATDLCYKVCIKGVLYSHKPWLDGMSKTGVVYSHNQTDIDVQYSLKKVSSSKADDNRHSDV
jgi:hypothetical protein